MSEEYHRQLVSVQPPPNAEQDLQGRPQDHPDAPPQSAYGSRRLNIEDALSYLDQVKSQFQNQPNVYNNFLDIMKDFNTQRIDTPGVIERVSNLFKGHPLLVEGFNTFLPPGYSIVCSTDPNDPNPITVTTPNGTITTGSETNGVGPQFHQDYQNLHQQQPQQQQSHKPQAPSYANGSTVPSRNGSITLPPRFPDLQTPASQAISPYPHQPQPQHLQQQPQLPHLHQQPQQPPQPQQPQQPPQPQQPQQPAEAELVPVEMDDAIGYVNKIKVRFTSEPHIYKSFLDLLQTYRREQRPIQEVYQQVAILFQNATDLLADFKKFLPDPDAVEPAQNGIQQDGVGYNEATGRPYGGDYGIYNGQVPPHHDQSASQQAPLPYADQAAAVAHQHQHQLPISALNHRSPPPHQGDDAQLPPFGNFQPPVKGPTPGNNNIKQHDEVPPINYEYSYSSERESLKPDFTQQRQAAALAHQSQPQPQPQQHQSVIQDQDLLQEQEQYHNVAYTSTVTEIVPKSNLEEELTFFDKVKKHIGNKTTYNNFIKLLSLFSNGIIDKKMLVERVEHYIGDSETLFQWFKKFVNFKETPLHIENIEHKKHRLELGLCKRYGASYRQLPKAETCMPCSGRDEMCWEVLNDEWVGHPMWDSEESGYIAHRKNQYEDSLFRIEEERHRCDFFMQNNIRTIQTLEVIASKLATMSSEEKANFKLPENLGHTSKTIYKKVIRMLYGKENGFKVVDALLENPASAVPIVLNRLKQKDEEWRKLHREWCKVWREQELKIFYKSLDHLGLTFKQTDKKLLTTKQLVSELSSIKVDQATKRIIPLAPKPKEQLEYQFLDKDVLVDISRLATAWIHASAYSANDKSRISDFFISFLGLFFNLNDKVIARLAKLPENASANHIDEESAASSLDAASAASISLPTTGTINMKKNIDSGYESSSRKRHREPDLLKDVLRRNKRMNSKKESVTATSSSREESVAVDNNNNGIDEELSDDIARAGETWVQTISKDNSVFEPDESILQDNSKKRSLYNLFCNTTIYVFFRYLQTLYDRLLELKQVNAQVEKEISGRTEVPFAKDLDLLSHQMEEMGINITGKDCYNQVLEMSIKLIEGEIEHQWFEESLRQAYRNKAFKLFTIDKVVQGLVKHTHNITSDNKTSEMMLLYEQDRTSPTTTTRQQIIYRMRVRSLMNPEENMFRIEYNEQSDEVIIQFVALDDLTLKDKRTPQEQYNYYLTSYLMSHPTEGVPITKINIPFVKSSINEEELENNTETDGSGVNGSSVDGYTVSEMKMHISKDDYKLTFDVGSTDEFTRYSVYNNPLDTKVSSLREKTSLHFKNKVLDGEFGWKNGAEENDVKQGEEKFKLLVEKTDPKSVHVQEEPKKEEALTDGLSENIEEHRAKVLADEKVLQNKGQNFLTSNHSGIVPAADEKDKENVADPGTKA